MRNRFDSSKGLNVYEDQQFDFIVDREKILQVLISSKINGSAVGVYSPALGNAMFITGVEEVILADHDTVIVLKQYDMSGHLFENYTLSLEDILSVYPFNTPLKNPFLDHLEKGTDWFNIINSTPDND
ncbi:MAG TPA: hypothetical protein VD884_19360 [Ohtaekwangia sp.]|nr:hypothetical protein [Ohtaekwangia sp.]